MAEDHHMTAQLIAAELAPAILCFAAIVLSAALVRIRDLRRSADEWEESSSYWQDSYNEMRDRAFDAEQFRQEAYTLRRLVTWSKLRADVARSVADAAAEPND